MTAETSFYFCVFKRIQVCAGAANNYPHVDPDNSNSENFYNLATSDDKGIFAPLKRDVINLPANAFGPLKPLVNLPDPNNPGGFMPAYPLLPASDPLANVPAANPLYAMFKASLNANGTIVASYWDTLTVAVQGSAQPWPIMPMCFDAASPSDLVKMWLEFNKPGPFTLVGALGDWIGKGKANDTPTSSLSFTKPPQSSMQHPVLFVCSKSNDDGVRPGGGLDHFWATSRIFLVYPSGPFIGGKAYPSSLLPTDEYNIVAQIGNSGTAAGRATDLSSPSVTVRAEAFPFNTFMAVAGFALPSLSNFDPADPNGIYEQYVIGAGSYNTAGFRFNVSDVFNGLESALKKAIIADPSIDLGGLSPKAWLAGSHPCVKVRIAGDTTHNPLPGDGDSPTSNRRIAQRNLAVFDHDAFLPQPPSPPPSPWHNFMVEQPPSQFDHGIGESTVRLTVQSTLPPEAFKLLLAIPPLTFKRYFVGGKGLHGFRVVPDEELEREIGRGRLVPFHDAVVLRATGPMSTLEFTVNAKHRVLGMSLGIVHDPARHPTRPTGAVSVIHDGFRGHAHEGKVNAVGGFTIAIGSERIDRLENRK
jgi:hypothetical protein